MALGCAAVLGVAAAGCSGAACTDEGRASLTVTVMGPGGRICDANVVAQSGTETTTLMPVGVTECTYAGPFEKAGTFTVTASKAGLQSATTTVVVTQGECHVDGKVITLELAPF
jgi:hypothetical protein